MNMQSPIPEREALSLTVSSFWLLRQSGAFEGYEKSELLNGELWGVPAGREDETDADAVFPIKLGIDDYELLDQAGAFDTCWKTELLDGSVYAMSPQHRPHGFVKDELAYRLRRALEASNASLHVATEQSVAFEPFSEPQPDIVLTSEPRGTGAIPGASVSLIVEIADSSLRFDLQRKALIYAAAGIAEYWVVDVTGTRVHQLWRPAKARYEERREIMFGDELVAMTIAGLRIATDRL